MAGLSPEKALIFRITHINNVQWILEHGIHCQSSDVQDPNFVSIGLPGLIVRRQLREIDIGPGGKLSDYVPFYFTPSSIMLFNIITGYDEVIRRRKDELVIFVSSLHRLIELDIPFVFTNGHAFLEESEYFTSIRDLTRIDWSILQKHDFHNDPEDPGKKGRYQAEALAHLHVPIEALLGVVCYNPEVQQHIQDQVNEHECEIKVKVLPQWYF